MIVHEQALWVVIGIFYLLQHVKFLKRNEACIFVSVGGSAVAVIPALPFETVKGVLYFIHPLAPHRALFRCHWGNVDPASDRVVRRAWVEIGRTNRSLLRLRIVAVMSWALFFLICPVLTWQMGLATTLLLAIPIWI